MLAYVVITAAGLLATASMSALLYTVQWYRLVEADMIRAVGSIFTRKEENAFVPGIVIHIVSGIGFGFLYIVFWSIILPLDSRAQYAAAGLLTGFSHGLVVSLMLVILVAEHHPLRRFREAGVGVAVTHLLAHMAYGITVGLIAGAFKVKFEIAASVSA
jgi:hypothetical protein